MRISVVVPVYKVARYIARCAESLLAQDFADKEIIFVDDASPDESVDILQSVLATHDSQNVSLLHHTRNKGLAAARLTGLQATKGEYIVSVDGDDYLEPNALSLLAAKAAETDADIIGMDCFFEWGTQRKIYRGACDEDARAYSRLLLSGATLPGVCLHMIRKRLYEQTDIWPIEGLNKGEDYVLTPRLCWFANRVAHVSQPLYHYTQTNSASFAHSLSRKDMDDLRDAVERLTAFFADKPECAEALRAGQWLKKTDMMMRVPRTAYRVVDTMPASLPVCTKTMNSAQRLVAPLIARKQWNRVYIYSRAYHALMDIIQTLKGRRKRAC